MTQEKPFNYIDEANVTASNKFYGESIALALFRDTLRDAITALATLDKLKKALFYNRELPPELKLEHYGANAVTMQRIPTWLGMTDEQGIAILHSIVGQATEAGELLEMLFESAINGAPFDPVHFAEEIGDCQWYEALGAKATFTTFDEIQRRNIAKLRHRFPNAFTEYDANNRDLVGERAKLESPSNPE